MRKQRREGRRERGHKEAEVRCREAEVERKKVWKERREGKRKLERWDELQKR